MNILEVRNLILKKELPHLIILTGEEAGIQDVYIKQIISQKGGKVKSFETLSDLWAYRLNTRIGAPGVLLMRNDDKILDDEKAWQCLEALKAYSGQVIVKFGKLDKRLKFGKMFADIIVDFERLTPAQLAKYITAKINCTQEQAVELAAACGCDYLRAMLECDKILRYSKIWGLTSAVTAFDSAVADGVLSRDNQSNVFEFVDTLVKRQPEAVAKWQSLKQAGESGVKVLSLLFTAFRNVLIAQSDPGGKGVTERTGLAPFLYFKAKENSGHFSNEALEKVLTFLKDAEQGVKLGKYEEETIIEYVMANIL